MRVPDALAGYDQSNERNFRQAVAEEEAKNVKRNTVALFVTTTSDTGSINYITVRNHTTGTDVQIKWTTAGWVLV